MLELLMDITEELVKKWAVNKTINPKTGKKIKEDGPTYNKYKKVYEQINGYLKERSLRSSDRRVIKRAETNIIDAVARARERLKENLCVTNKALIKNFEVKLTYETIIYDSLINNDPNNTIKWTPSSSDLQESLYEDLEPFLKQHALLLSNNTYDQEWINAQMEYIKALPVEDLRVINIYCGTANFYQVVNRFLRDPDAQMNQEELTAIVYGLKIYIENNIKSLQPSNFNKNLNPSNIAKFMNILLKDINQFFPVKIKKFEDGVGEAALNNNIDRVIEVIQLIPHLRTITNSTNRRKLLYSTRLSIIDYVLTNMITKFINKNYYIKILRKYTKTMQRLVRNAPPTRKEFFVYRGVDKLYHLNNTVHDKILNKSGLLTHDGFISTTLNPYITTLYTFGGGSNVFRIRVLPNTRCLILFPLSKYHTELEVLFPHGSQFFVNKGSVQMYVPEIEHTCIKDIRKIRVSEMTTIPHRKAKSILTASTPLHKT